VIWVNQIVQGILLGGYYAVLACGLSLMFGVMRIINLAHGDLAVLGAFLVFVLADNGLSPWVALAVVLPAMALLGWALQRTLLERSLRAGVLTPLLTTFGLAIVIQNLLFEHFGADERSLFPYIGTLGFDSWTITSQITVAKLYVLIFVVAVALLGGLQIFLKWSPLGRSLRATAQDPDTAELVGINSRQIYAVAAAIAVATAALAGAFLGMRSSFNPYSGSQQLIFAFEAVVIGGIGSLWGTLIGGIVLGVSQNIGAQISPIDVGPFSIFGPQWFLLTGNIVFLGVLAGRLVIGGLRSRGGIRAVLGQRA
jgi:branched-chain amino acid transport system permease protein